MFLQSHSQEVVCFLVSVLLESPDAQAEFNGYDVGLRAPCVSSPFGKQRAAGKHCKSSKVTRG